MRLDLSVEQWRVSIGEWASQFGDPFGMFRIPGPCGQTLNVIASSGDPSLGPDYDWDHVSVSLKNRCPNWQEMSFIKDLFWSDEETVMQLHVPKSKHINCHPYCLHLWRPQHLEIPLPPPETVGLPPTK